MKRGGGREGGNPGHSEGAEELGIRDGGTAFEPRASISLQRSSYSCVVSLVVFFAQNWSTGSTYDRGGGFRDQPRLTPLQLLEDIVSEQVGKGGYVGRAWCCNFTEPRESKRWLGSTNKTLADRLFGSKSEVGVSPDNRHLERKESFATQQTGSSMSASTVGHDELPAMIQSLDVLPGEVLILSVFAKLPPFDLLRARAVCKRWRVLVAQSLDTFHSQDETKSYCPLVFKRNSLQHLWCGYDSATGAWELLPPLTNLPQVDIRPLAGNGKSRMGFKITSVPSQVVVGNPFTSEWQTIPMSTETWGEVGNVLVVDRNDGSASFQIIAVREDATEIFQSRVEAWTKLRQSPPPGLHEITVLSMKDKFVSGTLCGGLLFCYCRDALVSFDVVAERWTEDHIRLPPHASPKCFQMLECGGNLFATIEDVGRGTISIRGLGLRRREFSKRALVEMPPQWYSVLCKKKRGGKHALVQLKAVGHKHCMYFWRNLSSNIVVFDYLRRTWAELPQFDQCLRHATGDQPEPDPEDFQTFVDTGSFEP